jgi:hypothetical protein
MPIPSFDSHLLAGIGATITSRGVRVLARRDPASHVARLLLD